MKKRKKDKFIHFLARIILRPFRGKPRFYSKENIQENAIIITNHNSIYGPLRWGAYFPYEFACWGGYVYFDNKDLARKTIYQEFLDRNNPKWYASIKSKLGSLCLMSGKKTGRIVSVYDDLRFYKTVKDSISIYKDDKFVIIFADDPSIKHTNKMQIIMPGALALLKHMKDNNLNPNVILAKQDKKGKHIYLDSATKFENYLNKYSDDNQLLDYFKNRINNLDEIAKQENWKQIKKVKL